MEGNTAEFRVRLTPSSEQTVTVDFATADVTAEAGTDYTARSGTLTFSARQTMMTISVPTTDDTERESDEHFRVTLSNPSGATLNDATGEGTIFDNDGGPTMPELSIGDASVEEGGMARFEVRVGTVQRSDGDSGVLDDGWDGGGGNGLHGAIGYADFSGVANSGDDDDLGADH